MNDIDFFIKNLKLITLKYENIESISLDKFNIFSILNNSSDEVNLHSKFIYELLNPKGSHQQGCIFLDIFLKIINIDAFEEYPLILREKENIDISVFSNDKFIIIENKIYSEDHSNQLSTYYYKVKNKGYEDDNIFPLYLTLFGQDPNEEKMKEVYVNISYEYHIKTWLELCIKEVAAFPTIREILLQYLSLVKKLTNQSQYIGKIMETKEYLLKGNNLKIALDMQAAITEAKVEVQLKFWKDLIKSISNKGFSFTFQNINDENSIEQAVQKFYTQRPNRKSYGYFYEIDDDLTVFIELDNNIFYGFYHTGENILSSQQEKIGEIPVKWEESSSKNYYWKYPSNKINFNKFNTPNVLELVNEKSRGRIVEMLCGELLSLVQKYQNQLN